jgi:hypothetical protein
MSATLASTLNLALQVGVLVLLVVAIRFAKQGTKKGFTMHGSLTGIGIILNLLGVVFVMIPSLVAYLSIGFPAVLLALELPHGAFGFLGLVLGIAFVLNKKPKNVKRWMDLNALFWFLAIILGFFEYFYIAGVF